jgi:hypothetical protein
LSKTTEEMKQRIGIKQLVKLALIIGLFFVVSGCLKKVGTKPVVVEKKQEVKKKIDEKVVEKVDEVKQDEIDTSDWLTYRNEELGVEIKYPKDWEYNLTDGITLGNKNNCLKNSIDHYDGCDYSINFNQYKEVGNYYKTVFEWRKNDYKNYNIINFEEALIKIKNINYKIIKFNHKNLDNWLIDSYYFIDSNNNGWEISIKYKNQTEERILNEIFNTFIFLKK